MKSIIVFISDTTFFASVRKFTKGVGQKINNHFEESQQQRIQKAFEELFLHRSILQRRRKELYNHLRSNRLKVFKRYYEDGINAARNRVYHARVECLRRWKFLEKHRALPLDPSSERQWKDFDEFLDAVDEPEEVYW